VHTIVQTFSSRSKRLVKKLTGGNGDIVDQGYTPEVLKSSGY